EAGGELGEEVQHLRRRVRLHGVEHARVRQRLGESQVVVADELEIDDEAGTVLAPVTQEIADARSHGALPNSFHGRKTARVMPVLSLRPSRDGDAPVRECSRPASAALDWNGESPFRTAGNDEQASTVTRADWWKAGRDQEARAVVALSRVPRGERGAPGSPPAAGPVVSELRRPRTSSLATVVSGLAPGGCPASCPDAHRPTHGHRHVRNWATPQVSAFSVGCKKFFCRRRIFLARRRSASRG